MEYEVNLRGLLFFELKSLLGRFLLGRGVVWIKKIEMGSKSIGLRDLLRYE